MLWLTTNSQRLLLRLLHRMMQIMLVGAGGVCIGMPYSHSLFTLFVGILLACYMSKTVNWGGESAVLPNS